MAQVYPIAAIQAAQIAGESPVMDATAALVAAAARSLANAHRVSGDYVAGIGVERTPGKRGVTDRLVYVDDPAAAHIEFGHVTRGGKDMIGPREWVEGLHIMGRAAGVR